MKPMSLESIVKGLGEISDKSFQLEVWAHRDPRGRMSSLIEASESIYDDSGFSGGNENDILVIGKEAVTLLNALEVLLRQIGNDADTVARVESGEMGAVREIAKRALVAIESFTVKK